WLYLTHAGIEKFGVGRIGYDLRGRSTGKIRLHRGRNQLKVLSPILAAIDSGPARRVCRGESGIVGSNQDHLVRRIVPQLRRIVPQLRQLRWNNARNRQASEGSAAQLCPGKAAVRGAENRRAGERPGLKAETAHRSDSSEERVVRRVHRAESQG